MRDKKTIHKRIATKRKRRGARKKFAPKDWRALQIITVEPTGSDRMRQVSQVTLKVCQPLQLAIQRVSRSWLKKDKTWKQRK